jgi:hypothetical protein
MRRAPVAAILVLALAPAASAAEATVRVTTDPGGPLAAATYTEPAVKLAAGLADATAVATVRQGAITRLQLRVRMPGGARLAPGMYATTAGASIVATPNLCGATPLAGTFTLHHAVPGARHTAPTELYVSATVHCGLAPATSTVGVRLQRPKSRAVVKEVAKAQQPVIDGLSTGWSDAKGQAVFAPAVGPRVRFSKRGDTYLTQGLDGGRGVVQHIRFAGSRLNSDLELWKLAPRLRLGLPGVNTRGWEWGGALSGDWLLFQRGEFDARSKTIRLLNLKRHGFRTVVTVRGRATGLEPGDLNGNFASYTKCTTRCRVTRYQLTTRRRISPLPPKGFSDYASSVLADGTLFFVRSRGGCGRNVAVMRLSPGAAKPVRVASVARGMDVQKLDSTTFAGTRLVVYERYSCNFRVTTRDDVRVVDAPPVPPAS